MCIITVKEVDFKTHFSEIKKIRTTVFIEEQNVPYELEWDESDKKAIHILAYYYNIAVGTARLLNYATIGRMAVLQEYRRCTVGKNMLEYLLAQAHKKEINHIELSAQEHAVAFYKKSGFTVASDVYLDAGIPHYRMKYTGKNK